jgi:hypothetical protein
VLLSDNSDELSTAIEKNLPIVFGSGSLKQQKQRKDGLRLRLVLAWTLVLD